jgi:hypothetical protein
MTVGGTNIFGHNASISALKIEALHSSETVVQPTRLQHLNNSQDYNNYLDCNGNLKSFISKQPHPTKIDTLTNQEVEHNVSNDNIK